MLYPRVRTYLAGLLGFVWRNASLSRWGDAPAPLPANYGFWIPSGVRTARCNYPKLPARGLLTGNCLEVLLRNPVRETHCFKYTFSYPYIFIGTLYTL